MLRIWWPKMNRDNVPLLHEVLMVLLYYYCIGQGGYVVAEFVSKITVKLLTIQFMAFCELVDVWLNWVDIGGKLELLPVQPW